MRGRGKEITLTNTKLVVVNFCSSNITIENCFLRKFGMAILERLIHNYVLLPGNAHAINIDTHSKPAKPKTTSHIMIGNIDILDHEENQL